MSQVADVARKQAPTPSVSEPVKDKPKAAVTQASATLDNEIAGANSKLKDNEGVVDWVKEKIKDAYESVFGADKLSKEATVTKSGDKTIIQTGSKDDQINITQDPKTGDVTVAVNGEKQTFSGKDKDNLVIKAGDGNDVIQVDKNVTVKLTLEGEGGNDEITVAKDSTTGHDIDGGAGDDKLNGGGGADNIKGAGGADTIEAGAGDDTVDGGDGRDYTNGSTGKDTLSGAGGDDVIYGGDGEDTIDGGDGNDYLEGSKGNDAVTGGKGNDILSGGLDDDKLSGGDGDDTLYAGKGNDDVKGDKGNNKIYAEKGDTLEKSSKGVKNTVVTVDLSKAVGSKVVVEGSDEFKERVEADLEMLRSSPTGRQMFASFDGTGKTVTIKETTGGNGATFPDRGVAGKPQPWYDTANKKNGAAVDGIISYNPSRVTSGGNDRPPIVGLYHEMGHAWDYTHGTLRDGTYGGTDATDSGSVNIRERVATGLTIDHDGDPATPERIDPLHPKRFSENGIRDEMNLPDRPHYN